MKKEIDRIKIYKNFTLHPIVILFCCFLGIVGVISSFLMYLIYVP